MLFSRRASLSCDCTHLIPLLRMALLPPTWVLGNLPFFFMMIVIDSKTTLTAIIINVNSKVLNISIIFALRRSLQGSEICKARFALLFHCIAVSVCSFVQRYEFSLLFSVRKSVKNVKKSIEKAYFEYF